MIINEKIMRNHHFIPRNGGFIHLPFLYSFLYFKKVTFVSRMKKQIIISTSNELVRVLPERIVYISSDGNYSTMVLHDKTEHLFTFNLSHFQKLIEKQLKDDASQFIRIGKSLIINRDYIYRINLAKQQLVMSDMALNQAFMLSASKEALKQLKQLLENELK